MSEAVVQTVEVEEKTGDEAPELYTASQWQLMGLKFRKHRLAVWSGWVI
ncbi:MAG: hypothetical protein HOB49_28895, partial [Gemmatimonadetes bacterium]|nr:hypothetical protein [Gemmatimonadota bacterium]